MEKAAEIAQSKDGSGRRPEPHAAAETESEEDATPAAKKSRFATAMKKTSLVNAKSKHGFTPLHFAVQKGHKEVCFKFSESL